MATYLKVITALLLILALLFGTIGNSIWLLFATIGLSKFLMIFCINDLDDRKN